MTGPIRLTAKERRETPRRRAQMPAMLNSHLVEITDLSLGGVRAGTVEIVADCDIYIAPGENATVRLPAETDFDGDLDLAEPFEFSEPLDLEIVRVAKSGRLLGGRFIGLSDRQRRFLAKRIQGGDW